MKIKLSKNQWNEIGQKAGWIKKAYRLNEDLINEDFFEIKQMIESFCQTNGLTLIGIPEINNRFISFTYEGQAKPQDLAHNIKNFLHYKAKGRIISLENQTTGDRYGGIRGMEESAKKFSENPNEIQG